MKFRRENILDDIILLVSLLFCPQPFTFNQLMSYVLICSSFSNQMIFNFPHYFDQSVLFTSWKIRILNIILSSEMFVIRNSTLWPTHSVLRCGPFSLSTCFSRGPCVTAIITEVRSWCLHQPRPSTDSLQRGPRPGHSRLQSPSTRSQQPLPPHHPSFASRITTSAQPSMEVPPPLNSKEFCLHLRHPTFVYSVWFSIYAGSEGCKWFARAARAEWWNLASFALEYQSVVF